MCENLKVLSILNCNLELNSKDYFKIFWTLKNWTYGNVTYVRLRALRQLLNEKQVKSCRERFQRKLKRMLREKRRTQEQDVQTEERKERIREQTRERVRRLREEKSCDKPEMIPHILKEVRLIPHLYSKVGWQNPVRWRKQVKPYQKRRKKRQSFWNQFPQVPVRGKFWLNKDSWKPPKNCPCFQGLYEIQKNFDQ